MFAVVSPDRIELPPGTVMRFPGTWQDYQALVEQLGDRQTPRLKYRPGEILLMSPLPRHGQVANLIAKVIEVFLDHFDRDYSGYTPITMDLPEVRGIAPDYCFYIEHWKAVAGKSRIDWTIDPPPDLAIEIDVTSYTDIQDCLPYRVPEVWLFQKNQLTVYQLEGEQYSIVPHSRYCPNADLSKIVADCLQASIDRSSSAVIRELRSAIDEIRESV